MTRLWGLAAAIVAMGIAACGGDGVGVHPPGEEETCTAIILNYAPSMIENNESSGGE